MRIAPRCVWILLVGLFSARAAAQDELAQRTRRLADLLAEGRVVLTDSQRQALQGLLDHAATEIGPQRLAAAAGPSVCYNEAYRVLSRESALSLCANGGDGETSRCFFAATRHLSPDAALRLCKDRGTQRTAECFDTAHRRLSAEQSVALCEHRGTEETYECFTEASTQLGRDDAMRLCQGGGSRERVACFRDATRHLAGADAVDYCRGRTLASGG